jgi:hypothetical protein
MHRRGTVQSSLNQHPIDDAVTLVTVPTRDGGRARTRISFARWRIRYLFAPAPIRGPIMDPLSLREKAALCLRIARRLSWNNPSRLQLADLADRFDRQAKEIESQGPQRDGLLAGAVAFNKS